MLKTGFAGPSNWPCCGVTAVATAAEVPFSLVLEHIRSRNNYPEHWKGSTRLPEREEALTHFGVTFKTRNYKTKYDKLHFWQWALLHAKPHVTYLVDVPGHTVVFRDGCIIDQLRQSPMYFAACDNGRLGNSSIHSTVEILSIASPEEKENKKAEAAKELKELF